MATAKIIKQPVQKIITVEEDVIVLELSRAEANTLLLLTGHTLGDKHTTARKYADKVYKALSDKNLMISYGTATVEATEFSTKSLFVVENY